MKARPSLPLLLVAGLAVIGVVGAVIAGVAAGDDFQPPAYTVNGHSVSQGTLNSELRTISDHPRLAQPIFGPEIANAEGSVTSSVTANWLNIRIPYQLLRERAESRHVTPTAANRATAKRALGQALSAGDVTVNQLPGDVRTVLVDLFAYRVALRLNSQQQYETFASRALRRAHVTIDSKYGTWHGTRGVCPPAGCARS
jgi:hypothetical protein